MHHSYEPYVPPLDRLTELDMRRNNFGPFTELQPNTLQPLLPSKIATDTSSPFGLPGGNYQYFSLFQNIIIIFLTSMHAKCVFTDESISTRGANISFAKNFVIYLATINLLLNYDKTIMSYPGGSFYSKIAEKILRRSGNSIQIVMTPKHT